MAGEMGNWMRINYDNGAVYFTNFKTERRHKLRLLWAPDGTKFYLAPDQHPKPGDRFNEFPYEQMKEKPFG